MSSLQRPLEGLLRPPLEWYSTASAAAGALLLVNANSWFLLPSQLSLACALALGSLSVYRLRQGWRVYRYTRNLKKMPHYAMGSMDLPTSNTHLFLGKGFEWKTVHAQRLRDLDLACNAHYCETPLRDGVRALGLYFAHRSWFKKFIPLLQHTSRFNPVRPLPDIGGRPSLHGVGSGEKDLWLSTADRAGHTVVIGTTGVGKTRFAELLVAQDIRRGDVVVVLDPKGDAELLKRMVIEARIAGREDDLIVFHLGFPELSACYNGIGQFTKVTQVATRLANGLPSTGNAAAFKEFAWKYVNLTVRALVTMGFRPTYKLLTFYITKLDLLFLRYCEEHVAKIDPYYEAWLANFIEENTQITKKGTVVPTRQQAIQGYAANYVGQRNRGNPYALGSDVLTDLLAVCRLDKTYYDKITASIGPLLEKLTTGQVGDLLSPNYDNQDDSRPIFDWLQVIRGRKIVYIGMDALTDSAVSSVVGNAMLSDFVSVAGHLYNYGLAQGFEGLSHESLNLPKLYLHADEFNEIIGDEFIPLLNKARGAGFNVTAYTQTWADVEARLGNKAKAEQTGGNFNNLVLLRTQSAETVNMITKQLPVVPIYTVVPASSSADTPHGENGIFYHSNNEDRLALKDVPLLQPNDILELPKGQAFARTGGGKLYKLRIPLPKNDDIDLPDHVESLTRQMRQRQQLINPINTL